MTEVSMRDSVCRFKLADLWVSVIVLACFIGVMLPAMVVRATGAPRVTCASNLRQIGVAIQMYANVNGGDFPRTRYDGVGGAPTGYTFPQWPDPF